MSDQMAADEVLTTTRAVRRRLDFDRPVEPELLRDCVRIALQAPALVIGCVEGRLPEPTSSASAMGFAATGMPAMWSFMLAARARQLGTAWTSMHLSRERDVAEILAIPYDKVTQFCLTPVAHTIGTEFRPARRPEPDAIIHWDRWS